MNEIEEKEDFSLLIYNFLKSIRNKKVSENNIQKLFDLIKRIDKGTEIQKRRFIMFFDVKLNQQLESYTNIAKKENCTCPAIRQSIIKIRRILINLKGTEKLYLIKIMKNNNI